MGIGASDVTVAVDSSRRVLSFRGNNWTRQVVTLNFTGLPAAPEDLVVVAYRKGVYCGGISAGGVGGDLAAAHGDLDTNTEEFEQSLVGLRFGDIVFADILLWNSNPASLELLGAGVLELRCSGPGYTALVGAAPATPLTGSSGRLGCFGWKDGKIYFRNDDIAGPNNWFPVALHGSAGSMYIDYSAPGESLT